MATDPEAPMVPNSDGDPISYLQAPLIRSMNEDVVPRSETFKACAANFVKVLLGAGMMALPRAMLILGFVPGLLILLAVCALTYYTLRGLVYASDKTASDSYGALVRASFGHGTQRLLELTMLVGCLLGIVLYLDIIADICLGQAPAYNGVITMWFAPETCGSLWFLQRPAALAILAITVLLPLMSMRNMERLNGVNLLGIGSLVLLCIGLVVLAGSAVAKGAAHALPIGPDMEALGSTGMQRLLKLANVLPVIITAAAVHQSVHPLRRLVVPYSAPLLYSVLLTSLGFVALLWVVMCICAYMVFGEQIEDDFLSNLTPEAMESLIGYGPAAAFSFIVRVGYAVSMAGSAVLIMFPAREVSIGLITRAPDAQQRYFMHSTCILLGTAVVVAPFMSSVLQVASLLGAATGTTMCFIMPGAILLRYKTRRTRQHAWQRIGAWGVVILGAALFVSGMLSAVLKP